MDSLVERLSRALDKEATQTEIDTGRRKNISTWEQYHERVGKAQGLRRAIDVLKEIAGQINKEDDGG